MKFFAPEYLKKFKCIAGKCPNNCCIGWEIDIDGETLEKYRGFPNIFKHVSLEGAPHFILEKDERCPFLDSDNLCKIIKEQGEDALCEICKNHPLFYSFFQSRTECGVGLSCCAAARLIIDSDFTLTLLKENGEKAEENSLEAEFFTERDTLMNTPLSSLTPNFPPVTKAEAYGILTGLERFDEAWVDTLAPLKENGELLTAVPQNTTAAKRLFSYFLFRHYHNYSLDFCIFCTLVILALGGDIYNTARAFSAEIEYSDQNCSAAEEWLNTKYETNL